MEDFGYRLEQILGHCRKLWCPIRQHITLVDLNMFNLGAFVFCIIKEILNKATR